MKHLLLLLTVVLFISFRNAMAQDSFSKAKWIAVNYTNYYAQQGGMAQPGPDYGCAANLRRPFWFVIPTCGQSSNSFNFEVYASNYPYNPNRSDSMSLVMWGPFDDTTNAFSKLTSDNMVDCYFYWTSQWNTSLNLWFHPQVVLNKVYYGCITTSDSVNSLFIDTYTDGMYQTYTDSDHCTLCKGRAGYMEQHICVVTVDSASGKNRIYWNAEDNTMAAYVICRQSSVLGQYDSIGRVEMDEPLNFIDEASDPQIKSYSYIMAPEDSCGRIHQSPTYFNHATMHLTTSVGLNGEVNLVWNQYSGILYSSYYIFRSVDNGAFVAIDSIASNTTTYTDLNSPGGELHYRVGIKPPSCYQGSEDYVYSNRSSVGTVGISEAALPDGVMLFPNPVHDKATLKLSSLAGKVNSIRVISVSGKNIITIQKPSEADVPIDVHSFTSGIYILEIQTDESIYRCRIAVQ